MASINTNKSGGMIRWDADDWKAGLIPHHTTNIDRTLTYGKGFSFSQAVDPFRRLGYATPGVNPTNATNESVVEGYVRNGVSNGTKAYLIAETKLHELTVSSNTLTTPTTFPHAITSCTDGQDVVLFYIGTTKYLFYSYITSGNGNMGQYDLSTTFDDDWLSTIPANAATFDTTNPHPLMIGDNNKLYMADGSNVHVLDGQTGANGTLTKNILALQKDYIITCFSKLPNYLVVFAYKKVSTNSSDRTEATAFFWDFTSQDPTFKYVLPGDYVAASFNLNGTVGCFVAGLAPTILPAVNNKLLLFTGGSFRVAKVFSFSTPTFGGVDVAGDMIYWNGGGEIGAYGSPYPDEPSSLQRIVMLGSTSSGMLKNFTGNSFWASSAAGAGGGLQKLNTGYNVSTAFAVPLVSPPFIDDFKARVRQVKIQWGDVASGGNPITVKLYTNKGQTQTTIVSSKTTTTEATLMQLIREDTSGVSLGGVGFDSIGFEVTYGTGASQSSIPPFIQSLEVYFDYTKI